MFPRLKPTKNAQAQMLKTIEGATLRFSRVGLGNGERPSIDFEDITKMQNLVCFGNLTHYERNGTNAIIHWQLDCASVENAFEWTEYALFALDENNNEFLFSYAYNEGMAQPISSVNSESLVMLENDINICIGDAEHVSAIIGEYSAYASKEIVEEHINNYNNPHKVTARDIGLECVENVSVNDATPTFTEATNNDNIVSGESASTLWGKVKKQISALIVHIANKNNPHGTTPEKIGAANRLHNHSATDINSGVLPPERGGTGKTSISAALAAFIKGQNITLSNGKSYYVTLPNGTTVKIAGTYDSGDIFLGSDVANGKNTHLHSGGDICFVVRNGTKPWYWYMTTAGNFYPGDKNNQNIGTTSNPIRKLYSVNGMTTTSDKKDKENITDAQIGQALLDKLNFKYFNLKDSKDNICGLIAQEVFEVFQELGIKNSSVYTVAVKDNKPDEHPELENLTDEQILQYDDKRLVWSLDYQQVTNYLFAAILQYRKTNDARLDEIEKKLKEVLK